MANRLHKGSKGFSVLGEELISTPDTFTDVEDDNVIQIPPTNPVSDSSQTHLEFFRQGTGDHYMSMSDVEVHLVLSVVDADGKPLLAVDKITPINLLPHALFSQTDVYLNEQPVNKNDNLYPYRAYYGIVCSYGFDAKASWLECELYYADTPGDKFDSYETSPATNSGLLLRHKMCKESQNVELIFKPHADLFMQSRPLPPNVSLRVIMTRSPAKFHLMGDGKKECYVKIVEANMYARILKLNRAVSLKHMEVLENNGMFVYPMRRIEMQSFTIGTGVMSFTRPNVLTGQLPRRILMGMVTNEAFVGNYEKSPFRFRPFGLRKANLIVDGRCIPTRPYRMKFDSSKSGGGTFTRPFQALTTISGASYSNSGNAITRTMFADGYTIIPFILAEDYHDNTFGVVREGSVQIELEFEEKTPEVLSVILYSEFESTLKIGRNGMTHIDF